MFCGSPEFTPKRHLDPFNRFSAAHSCVQQTHRQRDSGTHTEALSVTAVLVSAVADAAELNAGEREAGTGTVRRALVDRYSVAHLRHQVADVAVVWICVRPAAERHVRSAVHLTHCTPPHQTSTPARSILRKRGY